MNNYTYQNTLVSKKQLRQILSWSFTKYGSVQSCFLADELKYLGFKYATQAGISISIEDLRVPYVKNSMLQKANKAILNTEKICFNGKITEVERFQKIIDTWNVTSESLKDEVVLYFKKYDPLNSVYMMAFSGARGNLSQVRQLVGMRGLMSDPSGEIMNLPIKKNFREGLTITDYLMSGYGARKGIVDTALKTANSGYLTRRLIDVAQDIIIREKDCLTTHSFLLTNNNKKSVDKFYSQILGRLLNKPVYSLKTNELISEINTQITPDLIRVFKQKKINKFYIRSPLTCCLYRSICQKCYGWNLARENLVDIGDAVGIIAGQSIGEPGTQLTMRTFHTGGIFTSAASEQLISSIDGHVNFSKFLRTSIVRTNRGENVLLTENSASLLVVPNQKKKNKFQVELPRNTILFIKDNQYIKKGTVIGQVSGTIKQTRTEIKPVLSDCSGEVFMPKMARKLNLTTINKLLWILAGQVYQAPLNSFLNFYTDYKINKNSFIFRAKIVSRRSGVIKLDNYSNNLSEQNIEILNNFCYLTNSNIYKLALPITKKSYLFNIKGLKYLAGLKNKNFKTVISNRSDSNFANLIINSFLTLTGGTAYYTKKVHINKKSFLEPNIDFYSMVNSVNCNTIIWLSEETYLTNCDKTFLLVENGNFITENFELIPDLFSKTPGIIKIKEGKTSVSEITVKSGLLYEIYNIDNIKEFDNQIFYPGEILLENINITEPCLTEIIDTGVSFQLLIRPLEIYEVPKPKSIDKIFGKSSQLNSIAYIRNCVNYPYKSRQKVKENESINLLTKSLNLESTSSLTKAEQLKIEIISDTKNNGLKFVISEKFYLTHFIPAYLKYKNIQSSLVIENNQFVNAYTNLGYLEAITEKSLELVKFKSKSEQKKQILLISNDDCLLLPKSKVKTKTVNDFLINQIDVQETGKIIIDNGNLVTIQKGRPYFFPNCKNDDFIDKSNLEYKEFSQHKSLLNSKLSRHKFINIHYYDINNYSLDSNFNNSNNRYENIPSFSKIIVKRQGKLYITSCPMAYLRKAGEINPNSTLETGVSTSIDIPKIKITKNRTNVSWLLRFEQNSELTVNQIKSEVNPQGRIQFLYICKYPSNTFHSVTEDYLEQEVNKLYCKNGEFVENNQNIGLVNFEKEITGDIVQGLPRIEELLEARKRKKLSKRIPKNQKKGLLIRKTSLDPTFEFRKLGTTIKDNDKINPHSLLKIYFNYYAKVKTFTSQNQLSQFFRLTTPYESSYRSFKKVQSLILNSVQSVYESQGVTIADKHLEVVIKQMTSKVQIIRAGDTPLLPHEVVDLYHIKYINEVIQKRKKQQAYYVPLLLGVTKASLNNPSFISAASFQETTRVLTKAAIEGRRDWLRGLKENIVIGQLIPVGTGSKTYSSFFEKHYSNSEKLITESSLNKNFFQKN